jgi:hypothetical protein
MPVRRVITPSTGAAADVWTPPSDWINISNPATNSINLLVTDGGLATYAFIVTTAADNYTVNWGDGNTESFASGATAQHTYTVGAGQACSRGYTTFKISITSTSNITRFYATRPSIVGYTTSPQYLWAIFNAPTITTFDNVFYTGATTGLQAEQLESFEIINGNTVATTMSNAFTNNRVLTNLSIPNMTALTTVTSLATISSIKYINISGCTALTSFSSFKAPGMITLNISGCTGVTDATTSFNTLKYLKSVLMRNMTNLVTATSMFADCPLLESIDFTGSTAIQNGTSMLQNCYRLRISSITILTALTNISNMFGGCSAIKSMDASGLSNVTNASGFISFAYNLITLNITGMTKVTNADSICEKDGALTTITGLSDLGSAAASMSATLAFSACRSLLSISLPNTVLTKFNAAGTTTYNSRLAAITLNSSSTWAGTSVQLDVSYTQLDATALNALFTSLPSVAKTIKITGAAGAAGCTTSIATNKGWTVTN